MVFFSHFAKNVVKNLPFFAFCDIIVNVRRYKGITENELSKMTKEELRELNKGLRQFYGAKKELTDRTSILKEGGYTREYVDMVLRGKRNNDDIIELAVQILKEKREAKSIQSQRIKAAMEEVRMIALSQ